MNCMVIVCFWLHEKFFFVLFQVCEVYKLHRETYYLSLDFIDRYLSKEKCVIKHQLQLIGITSLFIAAKLEVRFFFFFNLQNNKLSNY